MQHETTINKGGRRVKISEKTRGQWSNEALKSEIDALDNGYKISQVCKTFQIQRTSLRDHYEGRAKSRKLGRQGVLTLAKKKELLTYLDEMVRVSCPLNIIQLRAKVGEIT